MILQDKRLICFNVSTTPFDRKAFRVEYIRKILIWIGMPTLDHDDRDLQMFRHIHSSFFNVPSTTFDRKWPADTEAFCDQRIAIILIYRLRSPRNIILYALPSSCPYYSSCLHQPSISRIRSQMANKYRSTRCSVYGDNFDSAGHVKWQLFPYSNDFAIRE